MQRSLSGTLSGIVLLALGSLGATLIAGNSPALGLDLQGGISVTQQPVGEYDPAALDLAVERIRQRVDGLGVAEPEILRQGDAIVVNLPGVKNQQEAIELVQVTGQVYLRGVQACQSAAPAAPVEPEPATESSLPGPSRAVTPASPDDTAPPAEAVTTADASADTDTGTGTADTAPPVDPAPVAPAPIVDAGAVEVLSDPTQQQVLPLRGGGQCLVSPAGATGAVFENDAVADIIPGSGWGVIVSLRGGAEGLDQWNALAAACFSGDASCPSRQLAIELDGEIISAPTVNEPRFTSNVQITGAFTEEEARNLARVLQSGSLPVRMQTQSVQNVSPTLGQDSLDAALLAGAIGVALVLALLVAYYGWLGLIVVAGLGVSGALLYSVISLLSRTQGLALSLAGAAGIIVSVGVTVDSYVVFFERMKDDVRAGRSLRASASRGFTGAWRTILIADIVSLIGAFTLWYLTVGAVRNFAFFLGLSTVLDLIVSYYFTRPAVQLLAQTDWLARRKVLGIVTPAVAARRAGASTSDADTAGGAS